MVQQMDLGIFPSLADFLRGLDFFACPAGGPIRRMMDQDEADSAEPRPAAGEFPRVHAAFGDISLAKPVKPQQVEISVQKQRQERVRISRWQRPDIIDRTAPASNPDIERRRRGIARLRAIARDILTKDVHCAAPSKPSPRSASHDASEIIRSVEFVNEDRPVPTRWADNRVQSGPRINQAATQRPPKRARHVKPPHLFGNRHEGWSGVKPREPRRKVMIQARMRDGARWTDALILNMSSRGLLVRSDQSPDRGSYLEIRRGPYVIVARVVWSNAGRFGVQTQDLVPPERLMTDPNAQVAPAPSPPPGGHERRAAPRPVENRHEASRQRARAVEFAAISLVGALVAVLVGSAMAEVVAKPLHAAQTALAAR